MNSDDVSIRRVSVQTAEMGGTSAGIAVRALPPTVWRICWRVSGFIGRPACSLCPIRADRGQRVPGGKTVAARTGGPEKLHNPTRRSGLTLDREKPGPIAPEVAHPANPNGPSRVTGRLVLCPGGAAEYSPRRKPWVDIRPSQQPRRGERVVRAIAHTRRSDGSFAPSGPFVAPV